MGSLGWNAGPCGGFFLWKVEMVVCGFEAVAGPIMESRVFLIIKVVRSLFPENCGQK